MLRRILAAAIAMLFVSVFSLAAPAHAKDCATIKKAGDCKDGCTWDKKKNSCHAAKAASKAKDAPKKDKAAAAKAKKPEPTAAKAKKAEPAAKTEAAKEEAPAAAPQNEDVPSEEEPGAEEDF